MSASVPVVTIDGPSGSGKGTVSQALARRLGWHFLDSGALYRVLACHARQRGVADDDIGALEQLALDLPVEFDGDRVLLDGTDVTDLIRTETVGNGASVVAVIPEVRAALLERQRAFVEKPGLVADGRDMGTVVFPDATAKIFLTASAEERARRRYEQLKDKVGGVTIESLSEEIRLRDERDRNRAVAPLEVPTAALELDSTALNIEEVLERVFAFVRERVDITG